ncbi:metallophosphoesterase [Parasediminibacterium sp. JCM 36343]|uniref:metallophosphoesterase n=1 Tax=Parasediminibacterium sp. JCM 36343 TaxID=3374279 RepID=UPI0039795717
MRSGITWWIVALIMLLLDIYVYQAIKTVSQGASPLSKSVIQFVYWGISILMLASLVSLPYIQALQTSKIFRNYVFSILMGLFLAKLIGSTVFLLDDIRRLFTWIVTQFATTQPNIATGEHIAIPRSTFLSWLGMALGGTLFGTLLYGFGNKYKYQVKRIPLIFPSLPQAFKGLRIVHISDIHSGSFTNKAAVNHGIDMILKEKADLILFTGDLVNDRHEEMLEYTDIFSRLTAPMGVYSTLGNHDYGDYVAWQNNTAKKENLEALKQIQKQMGWRLLLNEHIIFERGNDKIALLGIENYGAKGRFAKYGKMQDAHPGTENIPFKILMSHDPSHWDAQVTKDYKDVNLMLSGHTHGMQFGIENPYFKWSPVKWMYKQWAGLYENGSQKLYVNRGFGFIGYPGRVGIMPEITVIELVASSQ